MNGKMKKICIAVLLSIFCFCLAFGITACSNEKYEIDVDGYTLQIEEDGTYSIIGIPSEVLSQSTWQVPEKIGEYPISHLGSYYRVYGMWGDPIAIHSLCSIRKLSIPACIQSISIDSLYDLKVLESEKPVSEIEFKDSRLYYGACLLAPKEDNNNYTYITNENVVNNMIITVAESGEEATLVYAFGDGALVVPETYQGLPITTIGAEALKGEKFTSVEIGDHVKILGEEAFYGLPIKEFTFHEGIEEIGDSCFRATALEYVELPSSLKVLGENAFYDAKKLNGFDMSKTQVETIQCYSFSGCPLKGEMKFSLRIKKIGAGAFAGAEFSTITLPNALTQIAVRAFIDCKNIKEFILPDSVTSFDTSAVCGCEALERLHLGMIKEYRFDPISTGDCSLPALKDITVSDGNTGLMVENGILYSKDKEILYRCPQTLQVEKIVIDSSEVYKYAFYGNTYIKEVTFTENCKEIGNAVFKGCVSLEKVTLNNVIDTISFAVFRDCSSLKEINTGNIKYFEGACFCRCSSLQKADFTSACIIENRAFMQCDLREVKLGDNCSDVKSAAFFENANLTSFDGGRAILASNALGRTPITQKEEKPKTGCNGGWRILF